MADDDSERSTTVKTALDHTWGWFTLHATQRLQSVNFYLIAMAFLSAAFVTAVKEKMNEVACGVSALAVCISFLFYKIEQRIRSLIHASESALKPLQDELARSLNIDDLRVASRVEVGKSGEWMYSKVFRYLYCSVGATFALGFFHVVLCRSSESKENPLAEAAIGLLLMFAGCELVAGLPDTKSSEKQKNASRWAILLIGIVSAIAGVAVLLHFSFALAPPRH